jgi:peptidoglycan/xylan/chitin deacetylase (PgdA/CDA1 family)
MVLDALSEEGVPATFFVYGSSAKVYPTVVKVCA